MATLQERGFDRGTRGCSQCQALSINGVACHETGCPNATHECKECMAQIPLRARLCGDCIDPDVD